MANLYIIIRAFLKHFLNNLSIFRLLYQELKMHILPKIRAFKSVPYLLNCTNYNKYIFNTQSIVMVQSNFNNNIYN